MKREATVERKTKETAITVHWVLDGEGTYQVSTGIPFFDHMLCLFGKHGLFGLEVDAKGDIEVDYHHTVEDVGIAMGRALRGALGEMEGVKRYGSAIIPMDECLSIVAIDLSGRPAFVCNGELAGQTGTFDTEVVKEFFKAFANEAKCTLHVNLLYGENVHHKVESVFKAFGRALSEAAGLDQRIKGPLSTKGVL